MSAEEALVREISARGPQGVAAYRLIPREELKDKDKAKGWFERSGAAGVVALRIVGKEEQRVYYAVVWSSGYYGNFYDYYGSGWAYGLADREGAHRDDADRRDAALSRGGREAAVGRRRPDDRSEGVSASFMKDLAKAAWRRRSKRKDSR